MNKKTFWGVFLILSAVVIILDSIDLFGSVSIFRLLLYIMCIAWFTKELLDRNISKLFFPAAFIFLLFEKYIGTCFDLGTNIISNWVVLLAALLLTVGVGFLTNDVTFGKRLRGHVVSSRSSNTFGEKTKYIDCSTLGNAFVKNSFGETNVYFQNVETFTGGTVIIENSYGEVTLHVPHALRVKTEISSFCGEVNEVRRGEAVAPTLLVTGKNSFGEVNIIFE